MSEFMIFLLVVVSAGFCYWPFVRRQPMEALSTRDTPLGRVQQRKETLLQNIADLDFEFSMGKLSDEDYNALRATLKSQAAGMMEQIDVLEETDALIGRRPKPAPKASAEASADSGAPATDKSAFCSSCGTACTPGASFCSSCGHELA